MRDGTSKSRMDDPTTPRYAMSGFYIEKGGFLYAAAIDARHRTCLRRHDMAAELAVCPLPKKGASRYPTDDKTIIFASKTIMIKRHRFEHARQIQRQIQDSVESFAGMELCPQRALLHHHRHRWP